MEKVSKAVFVPIQIIIRQYFLQLLLSTNPEKKRPYLNVDMVKTKTLILPSVLI